MGCDRCKRKGIPFKCPHCPGEFCVKHMQLEEHKCPGITTKQELYKKTLEKQLAFEAPRKLEKI
jgi:predicted nucleic acid binding AN1-type Zn finger protein